MRLRRTSAGFIATLAALVALASGGVAPATGAPPTGGILVNLQAQWLTGEVTPLAQAQIFAINQQTGAQYQILPYGDPASSDHYQVGGLPYGSYTVRMQAAGFATQYWSQAYSEPGAVVLDLQPIDGCNPTGGTPCYVQVLLPTMHQNASLSGYVRNRSGQAVPGIPVTATRTGETTFAPTSVTDGKGHFSLAVPTGTYRLSAPNGNTSVSETVTVTGATARTLTLLDPPTAPRDVQVVVSSRQATVSWDDPQDDGGTPVTDYTVTSAPGGRVCTTQGARSCTVTGLTNNTTYTFTVRAENAVGTGPASTASAPVTPLDPPPGAPRSASATAGDRAATVTWSPPERGADTVTGYQVQSQPGGHTCTTTGLSCEVPDLVNGTRYTFAVTADSTGGTSPAVQTEPVVPAGVPGPPRNVRAAPGDKYATVSWGAPDDDGGAPILGYTVTAYPGGRTCTTEGQTTCTVSGLLNGTSYSFTVIATNRAGQGPASPGSAPVTPDRSAGPPHLPPQVLAPTTTLVGTSPRVRWSAPGAAKVRVIWQVAQPQSSGYGSKHKVRKPARGAVKLPSAPRGSSWRVRLVALSPGGKSRGKTTLQLAAAWKGTALKRLETGGAALAAESNAGKNLVVQIRGSGRAQVVTARSGEQVVSQTVTASPGARKEVVLGFPHPARQPVRVSVSDGSVTGFGWLH